MLERMKSFKKIDAHSHVGYFGTLHNFSVKTKIGNDCGRFRFF